MTIIDEIVAERQRQINGEGWSTSHDDTHDRSQLARAAVCYALPESFRKFFVSGASGDLRNLLWPWDRDWWKPKDRRRDLIRAGALIIAEIERLDRKLSTAEPENK